jgi:hypothetical protein
MAHRHRLEIERDVRSLLRPSEQLVFILKRSYLRRGGEGDSDLKAPPSISSDDTSLVPPSEETRVILAIVGHMNNAMEERGRSILNTFTLSFSAEHSLKCVSLHRGRGAIKCLPSRAPAYICNSQRILS